MGRMNRRSFLDGAGRVAGAMTLGAIAEAMWPVGVLARQAAKALHPASAQVVDRLRTRFTFQMSVDVGTLEQGLVEMGTPLLKNQGVANVVRAFRAKFPDALLLADMKTMDGGGFEARGVYAGGGNIVDFLALAGVDTARAICAVRDEFRVKDPVLPRLAFADILVPHQGPATQAADVARRMLDAGVDGVGIHLQSDARRADPSLIERNYLGDVARAVFEKVGRDAPVQEAYALLQEWAGSASRKPRAWPTRVCARS